MTDSGSSSLPFKLIAIAAMAENRVIGRGGRLPWHLPEDLQFFKSTTLGHPVLMGRKTFDSILTAIGKPLPGRQNIVLSQTLPLREDALVIRSLPELSALTAITSPVYLIGGAELYRSLLPLCAEILLTRLMASYEGDTFFPPFEDDFQLQETLKQTPEFEIQRYCRRPD